MICAPTLIVRSLLVLIHFPLRETCRTLRAPWGAVWSIIVVALSLMGVPQQAIAQDDDPGFVTRLLQDSLSGPGREVTIRGFEGALSGRATMTEMTFADDQGVWFRLEGAVLDWSRAALLRGRLNVAELSAERIELSRLPATDPTADTPKPEAPAPEASGFALPELPVSVDIGQISIKRASLGEPVMGVAADLTLDGRVTLSGGTGDIDLTLDRLDGPSGQIRLRAGFDNETRVLALDIGLDEAEGGLAATLLKLPDTPSVALSIAGEGPLDNYTADIDLTTAGAQRVGGQVTLRGQDAGGLAFAADIGGDITPLLPPEFHDFFGPEIGLNLAGTLADDGSLDLPDFALTARSLNLAGNLAIGANGLPTGFALRGAMVTPDGQPVRLPVAGDPVTLDRAQIEATFDAAQNDRWGLTLLVEEVQAGAISVGTTVLSGGGRIAIEDETPLVTAELAYGVNDLDLGDPALVTALGRTIEGAASLGWRQGAPLRLEALTLGGGDYGIDMNGTATFADRTVLLEGAGTVSAQDLSRFAAVSGQNLTGQAQISLTGRGDVLGGTFALEVQADASGVSIGNETVDPLLNGPLTLNAVAERDTTGIDLDTFSLDTPGVTASAMGRLGSGAGGLQLEVALTDLGLVLPDLTGPVTLTGTAREPEPGKWDVDVDVSGAYGIDALIAGRVATGETNVTLDISLPDIAPFAPGFTGAISVTGSAAESAAGLWDVDLDAALPYDAQLALAGKIGGGAGQVTLDGGLPDVSPLAPGVTGAVTMRGEATEQDPGQWRVALDTTLPYDVSARVNGLVGATGTDVLLNARLPDIGAVTPGLTGEVTARVAAAQIETGGWMVKLDTDGPYAATARIDGTVLTPEGSDVTVAARLPDISPLVPSLSGAVSADLRATQDPNDPTWKIGARTQGPVGATVNAVASVGGPDPMSATLNARLPDIAPLAPGMTGAVTARIDAAQTTDGSGLWMVDADIDGPYRARVTLDGAVGAENSDIALLATLPDIAPLAPGLSGSLRAAITAAQTPDNPAIWALNADIDGPYRSTVDASGQYGAGASDLKLAVRLPDVSPLVPTMNGPVSVDATAAERETGLWAIDAAVAGPYNTQLTTEGTLGLGETLASQSVLDLALDVPSITPFVAGLTGPVRATGRLSGAPDGYGIALATSGPGTAQANIGGTLAADFATANLTAQGTAPLALANGFIAPQQLLGDLSFDLGLNGALGLPALGGTISMSGVRLSLPTIDQALTDIGATITLNGGSANLDVTASGVNGGGFTVTGPINLTTLSADITTDINSFVARDPRLFTSTVDGRIRISGPLTGGANIAGRVDIGRTEIRIPDSGLGFGGAIPAITHIREPGAVLLTRERAGLVVEEESEGGGGGGPVFGLDLTVSAPQQIFIRGRGLDVELGGGVRVGGTTLAPTTVGEVEVIRGRLDILGKRLEMDTDSRVTLGGDLMPFLDFRAFNEGGEVTTFIDITGPVDDPEFTFSSSPSLPEDEVLAYLIFGKSLQNLSAFQALELANSVAQLTGRGGPSLLGGIREGLGVDDLSIVTDEDGNTGVQAGKYLSENIYTDVTTSSDGTSTIELNIDLTDTVTVKGIAESTGESALGIYFERDY